ncbi:MAG TPA: FMN-binding negative transcriptional regulator [Puia sp.]|nr:FMN-binding negative transcriptional regulator [Puia sp.]
MYIPRRYEEKDIDTIHSFIRENSFGLLVSVKDGVPAGTHLPLLLEKDTDGQDILMGHISRGNEQKHTLTDGAKVMVVFAGAHAYISPRWYTQMNVPTWNYIAVHVYGTVKIVEGDALHAALRRLVDHYEHPMPRPVSVEEIPEKTYFDDFRGIVGFKIIIDEMQAAYKLSQNRDEQSYHQVVDELEKGDDAAKGVAAEMKKRANIHK